MADSFTGRLRFRLQATGANINTWGSLLNAAALQLIDDAISGMAQVTMAATDVTLSVSNGSTDQARQAIIQLVGAPTTPLNVIVPSLTKVYLIVNATGQVMTVKTSGGTGVAIGAGLNQYVYCDAVNVNAVQAAASGSVANALALGGFAAALYPRLAVANEFTAAQAVAFSTVSDGSTVTINALLSNNFYLLIGGNRTLVINNPSDGQRIEFWIQQDVVGGRTLTFPGNVQFEGGSSNALTGTASATDRFQLTYNLALNLWIARRGAQAAAAGVVGLVLSTNEVNVSLWERAGSPAGLVTVNVTIAVGAIITSTNTATPALDTTNFFAGSIINLVNQGFILGCGGDGGKGSESGHGGATTADLCAGAQGFAGGPALKAPGAGITLNITNGSGNIWGGGGGGGGGGSILVVSGNNVANGGGGGGGKGGSNGGPGGQECAIAATVGLPGTGGSNNPRGVAGSGGAGAASGGGTGSVGGNGGDWGSGGSAGTTPGGATAAGGAAGAGGKAIDLNGGTVAFVSGSGGPNIKGLIS